MRGPRKTWHLVLLLLATSLPVMLIGWRFTIQSDRLADHSVSVKWHVDGAIDRVDLHRNADGTYIYLLQRDGRTEPISPEQFADRIYRQQTSRGLLSSLFNISSPIGLIWVSIGLLGQVLFTGRMVIQWLASEKNRRSVVPPMFWWMSLMGALMLLSYFLWRRDIVGVLGQSFGLIIYVRNLYFIYGTHSDTSAMDDPGPEPELADCIDPSPSDALNMR